MDYAIELLKVELASKTRFLDTTINLKQKLDGENHNDSEFADIIASDKLAIESLKRALAMLTE